MDSKSGGSAPRQHNYEAQGDRDRHKAVLTEGTPHHLLVLLRPLDGCPAGVVVAGPEAATARGIGKDDEGALLLERREAVLPRAEVGHVDPSVWRGKISQLSKEVFL